jgi:hypothetical protein
MFIETILGTKQRFATVLGTWYRILIAKTPVAICTNPSQIRKIAIDKISSRISFFFEPSYV